MSRPHAFEIHTDHINHPSISELSDRLGLTGTAPSNSDLLFNDTTRLRQNAKARSSLSNIFSHEAPSLPHEGSGEAAGQAALPALPNSRPKEPPPPPPPVAEVLKPMVPPKRSSLIFTQVMIFCIELRVRGVNFSPSC